MMIGTIYEALISMVVRDSQPGYGVEFGLESRYSRAPKCGPTPTRNSWISRVNELVHACKIKQVMA